MLSDLQAKFLKGNLSNLQYCDLSAKGHKTALHSRFLIIGLIFILGSGACPPKPRLAHAT